MNTSVTVDGLVAVIEISRPPANFFDVQTIGEIADAGERVAGDGVRAIVLCSQGKHFCAGADFGGGEMVEDRSTATRSLYREAMRVFAIPVPVIAAVQGSAVGGGVGLACAADFRVASPATRFHTNFSMLGFHQGFALSATLPHIVGPQHAADLLYTSRRIDGRRAHEIGLVDRLAADGDQREEALRWAQEIAAAAPLAVRSIKATLREPLAERAKAVLERELAEQVRLWETRDASTGIAANLARETPQFEGA